MCGIAGYISFSEGGALLERENISNMLKTINHRGPDSNGIVVFDKLVLGNNRLAIIDLSENANLPMSTKDESVLICFNGEISNYKELLVKYDLKAKYDFKSDADTEVILYLYKLLGIDFINELSGMFVFTLFDKTKNTAFIVRDFYGILPLFYYQDNKGLYFAS